MQVSIRDHLSRGFKKVLTQSILVVPGSFAERIAHDFG